MVKTKIKKHKSLRGGARPGAGRPKLVKDGMPQGIYMDREDIKMIRLHFPGVTLSEFYRVAAHKILEQAIKKQIVLEFS